MKRVRELKMRIPFRDRNGIRFKPAKQADVAAKDDFSSLRRGKPKRSEEERLVRGVWCGKATEADKTQEDVSQAVFVPFNNQAKVSRTESSRKRNHFDPAAAKLPLAVRDREKSLDFCRQLYNAKYTSTSEASSPGSPYSRTQTKRKYTKEQHSRTLLR